MSPSSRERGCGIVPVVNAIDHPSIRLRKEHSVIKAKWRGLSSCGHIWTCPVCAQGLRSKRAARAQAAMRRLGGRWQMLTVTVRHHRGQPLKKTLHGLLAAWRRTRQGGRIQRVWGERVTASVRAVEVTYGGAGWHPHVHVLLRTTEWDEDDRDALHVRYVEAVRRELGDAFVPNEHALRWSEPITDADADRAASYVTKLGLEVTAPGKGHSAWTIAARAAEGDREATWLWNEFFSATRGRRMLELDDRASQAADEQEELDKFDAEGEMPDRPLPDIVVTRDEVRTLRSFERSRDSTLARGIFALCLKAAEADGEAGVREWIAFARSRVREVTRCSPASLALEESA